MLGGYQVVRWGDYQVLVKWGQRRMVVMVVVVVVEVVVVRGSYQRRGSV